MAISTYGELKTAIADWLNRADLDQQIPDFIRLAETSMNDVLRSSFMVSTTTVTTSTSEVTLPADALELVYVQVSGSDAAPLEQVSPQQLITLRRARLRTAGTPKFFAIVGRKIMLAPAPASSTTISLEYYAKIPALSAGADSGSNWLLDEAPHIYLYGALMHASPFLMDDARAQVMQSSVATQIQQAVRSSQTLSFDDLKKAGFSMASPADNQSQFGETPDGVIG